jgi:hypothetical protein
MLHKVLPEEVEWLLLVRSSALGTDEVLVELPA